MKELIELIQRVPLEQLEKLSKDDKLQELPAEILTIGQQFRQLNFDIAADLRKRKIASLSEKNRQILQDEKLQVIARKSLDQWPPEQKESIEEFNLLAARVAVSGNDVYQVLQAGLPDDPGTLKNLLDKSVLLHQIFDTYKKTTENIDSQKAQQEKGEMLYSFITLNTMLAKKMDPDLEKKADEWDIVRKEKETSTMTRMLNQRILECEIYQAHLESEIIKSLYKNKLYDQYSTIENKDKKISLVRCIVKQVVEDYEQKREPFTPTFINKHPRLIEALDKYKIVDRANEILKSTDTNSRKKMLYDNLLKTEASQKTIRKCRDNLLTFLLKGIAEVFTVGRFHLFRTKGDEYLDKSMQEEPKPKRKLTK